MPDERSIEELLGLVRKNPLDGGSMGDGDCTCLLCCCDALGRAVARLRKYATHLPECATRHPRPADAPENQCSCGFAALTPKGGDRE